MNNRFTVDFAFEKAFCKAKNTTSPGSTASFRNKNINFSIVLISIDHTIMTVSIYNTKERTIRIPKKTTGNKTNIHKFTCFLAALENPIIKNI